uniref:UDP-glucuronosyltransferase n=1 Tax=Strigamia maritima TaxID=126957 RepID=T1IRC4_STRMM|nr:UDP-glycosyltransferase 211B1 [Strigamia maritima]
MKVPYLFLTIFLCSEYIEGYKVLYLFPFASKSHKNIFDALITELARRDHEVTVISELSFSQPVKNVKEIIIKKSIDFQSADIQREVFGTIGYHPIFMTFAFPMFTLPICKSFFQNSDVKKLLKKGKQFDMVIVSGFLNECALATAPLLGKYIISQSPGFLIPWNGAFVPQPPSYVPHLSLSYTSEMSFFQRLNNLFTSVSLNLVHDYYIIPTFQSEIAKHIPENPSILEARNLISLHIDSADPVLTSPRPSMPNIVSVGGIHCKKAKPLPQELEDFVQSSGDNGFIYFSLGSNAQSRFLPEKVKTSLLAAFSKLKQKVIWKYEEELKNAPSNVKVIKWAPQQDLLGHPKIKGFITHGGLLSLQETVYNAVPVVAVPILGDQHSNIARVEELKIGYKVDFNNISEVSIFEAVNEILKESYKENMMKYSAIFHDRYQQPLEQAVFWVEYVIKNDCADCLKSVGEELNFLQYFLIDVIAFISIILLFVVFGLIFLVKLVMKIANKSKLVVEKKQQ